MGGGVDVAVVGGGIVGLATALAITEQRPGAAVELISAGGSLGSQSCWQNV